MVCNKCDGMGWDEGDLVNEVYGKLKLFEEGDRDKEKNRYNEG